MATGRPIDTDITKLKGINFGMKIKSLREEPELPAIFLAVDMAGCVEPEDGHRGFT